ncbi:MAG: acetyl-CoA carboxylase biotin carboxylase subunit family protein [Planctomycetota bacterium]
MANVVFAVPFVMESSLRFVRAAALLPGVRVVLLSQDGIDKVPPDVRQLLTGFRQLQDGMDPEELTAAVRQFARQLGSVDALLGVLEPLQEPLGVVRERLRIRGMDAATAANFRDKARMKDVLAAHDLPCARHRLCEAVVPALEFGRDCGYPLVLKPPAGAGAKTTVRIGDEAELKAALQQTPPAPGRPVLLEEFVQGREFSFDSVSLGGRHLFHSISDYHPTPLQVLENPWVQWCVVLPRSVSEPKYAAIHRDGPRALTALGMVTGMTHMEWFRRGDGSIAIGEVAARPPGAQFMTLMSYAHDTDMYRAWAQLSVLGVFEPPRRAFAAGAVYLRGQGEGSVQRITGLHEVQRRVGDVVVEARLPKQGQGKAQSYEGEGYVIVRHPETAVVEAALNAICETLRIELG